MPADPTKPKAGVRVPVPPPNCGRRGNWPLAPKRNGPGGESPPTHHKAARSQVPVSKQRSSRVNSFVVYVKSVDTVNGTAARVKAESVLPPLPQSTPASIFYRVPLDEAPRCGECLLVTVEVVADPHWVEVEVVKPANTTIGDLRSKEAPKCRMPIPSTLSVPGACGLYKDHTGVCRLDTTPNPIVAKS